MVKMATFLMFEGQAEEAMNLYVSLFSNSSIESIHRYGANEAGEEGTVSQASFILDGKQFMCMDSVVPHHFTFTPSMSIIVTLETEDEIDRVYAKLIEGGEALMPLNTYPFSDKYGWVNDKFGVSWQLTLEK